MNYRRCYVSGGVYFFTVVTHKRVPVLCDNWPLLKSCFRSVYKKYPFKTHAMVVLPDHLHCIWSLPETDADYSKRWRLLKTAFRKELGLGKIWQNRFWEHCIRNEDDYSQHVEYIHNNPVKHGYVSSPADWPFSSFHTHRNTT